MMHTRPPFSAALVILLISSLLYIAYSTNPQLARRVVVRDESDVVELDTDVALAASTDPEGAELSPTPNAPNPSLVPTVTPSVAAPSSPPPESNTPAPQSLTPSSSLASIPGPEPSDSSITPSSTPSLVPPTPTAVTSVPSTAPSVSDTNISLSPTSTVDPSAASSDSSSPIASETPSPSESADAMAPTDSSSPTTPSVNNSAADDNVPGITGIKTSTLVAISVSAAVAVIATLGLVVFIIQRFRPTRQNDSDNRFLDGDDPSGPGGGGSATPGVGGGGAGPGVPPPGALSSRNDTITTSAITSSGPSATGSVPFYSSSNASKPLPGTIGGQTASAAAIPPTRPANLSELSMMPPPVGDPSAPSPSQFTRRESEASSASSDSDTIVAPIYANDSVNTNTAAPWFELNRSDLRTQ